MTNSFLRSLLGSLIILVSSQLYSAEPKWFTNEDPYPFGFDINPDVQNLFLLAPSDAQKASEQVEELLNHELDPKSEYKYSIFNASWLFTLEIVPF
jgi:hypothetical protein